MSPPVPRLDQFGQFIDVVVSERRDLAATRRFFVRALEHAPRPAEVITDRAQAYPRRKPSLVIPGGLPVTERVRGDALNVLNTVVSRWPI